MSSYARETEARAEFARREEPYLEAERGLLLHPAPTAIYWHGTYLRRVLADRFAASSALDAAVIDNLRHDQLEALLAPVEARDARREALAKELCLADLAAETESALDAREDIAKKIYRLPARSLDGLALKTRVLKINEPGLWERPSWKGQLAAEWHEIALTEIADGVEHLIAMGEDVAAGRAQVPSTTEPEVDWQSPPPGFMAYPAGEPTSFVNIGRGLQIEIERLHQIALQEVARRSSMDNVPEFARPGRLDQLRRQYRLAELERAANPERAIPTETIAANGTVYYEDASGKAYREPVARWIAFMTQRMNSVARQEAARLFSLGAVQDQDANSTLHDRLRRTLRLDALHDLMCRADGVFEAAKECAVGSAPIAPRTVGASAPDPVLAVIERHRQAYAEWFPFMEVTCEFVSGTPEFARARADESGPAEREQAAYGMVLTARPTTLAGLIAWAGYLPRALAGNSVDPSDEGARALASMCDAVLSLVPIAATHPVEHPDAALIALGVELAQADARLCATQDDHDAGFLAADAALKSVLDRVAALPALTVEGMHVKLRAFQDAAPHMDGPNWGKLMLRSLMRDAGVTMPESDVSILDLED